MRIAEGNAERFGGCTKLGIELLGVVVFEVAPGDELGEFDPTIVATEVATEGQIKVFEGSCPGLERRYMVS